MKSMWTDNRTAEDFLFLTVLNSDVMSVQPVMVTALRKIQQTGGNQELALAGRKPYWQASRVKAEIKAHQAGNG